MDSMRSLNTSLPSSSTRRPKRAQPSGELLQAFKAAALSVTQLYKTAASDEDSARAAGYQDAIDELLAFLDSEDLGLGDGEGWRVRQWATERISPASYGSDGEDNNMDDETPTTPNNNNNISHNLSTSRNTENRSEGSVTPKSSSAATPADSSVHRTSSLSSSSSSSSSYQPQQDQSQGKAAEIFHFRSSMPLPTADASADSEMVNDDAASGSVETSSSTPVVRLVPRTSRPRGPLRDKSLGSIVAGVKRKPNINDFFDFSNIIRDGSIGGAGVGGGGGGKKVRFV